MSQIPNSQRSVQAGIKNLCYYLIVRIRCRIHHGASVAGGEACNVWWRIGSAATLGTTASFLGNIVVDDDADTTALGTGATLNGRVLGGTGQTVTLAGNTITGPTCAASSTSSSSSSLSSIGGGPRGPAYCPPINSQVVVPSILESRRIDADSIFLRWGPYSGTDKFNIQYGTTNGNWLYNVDVTGFSTTINALPRNQPIWVRIAARNECMLGEYGQPRLVGGPMLPSTGFAPESNVLAFIGIVVFLGLTQRKYSR